MAAESARDVEVVGLGQACVDYRGRISSYPREDEKTELEEFRACCGGPAATAMVALSRLGVFSAFLGSISDDPFGLNILTHLRRERLDVSHLKITPGCTSQFSFIAVNQSGGKRTIFWHRGSAPPLSPKDVDLDSYRNAKVLHVDGLMMEASVEAARQAKALGMTVVMDAGTMREGAGELTRLVDVLIASRTFPQPLVGSNASPLDALHALKTLCPGRIVVTMGSSGSIGLDGSEVIRQKAFPVEAVDTTGAGDVFHGAYIYGILRGWSMDRCMRFSSAASALKCRNAWDEGDGMPDLHSVLRMSDAVPKEKGEAEK